MLIKELFSNEIQIDEYWQNKLYPGKKYINFRPIKYKKLNGSVYYYYLLLVSWLPILVLFNIFLCLSSLFKIKYRKLSLFQNKKIWIDSSLKSENIKRKYMDDDFESIDIRKKEFISFLPRSTRFKVLLTTLKCIWQSSKWLSSRNKLQLIDLYYVLCFYEFISLLNSFSEELHICNHYDRWAMCCYLGFSKGVNLWQHGLLGENFELKKKLPNIISINYLNNNDISWWQKNISGEGTIFKIQKNTFSLTQSNYEIDILIASNPVFIAEELTLMDELRTHEVLSNLNVAYKPHPVFNYGKKLTKINKKIAILNKFDYPPTRLLIHRYSTLGLEYESIGITALEISEKDTNTIVSEIYNYFNTISNE